MNEKILKDLESNNKKCSEFITFRLSVEDLNKVKLVANKTNTNISKVIKSLIKNYL